MLGERDHNPDSWNRNYVYTHFNYTWQYISRLVSTNHHSGNVGTSHVTWRLRLQCDASLFLQYIQDSLVCCNLLVLRTNTSGGGALYAGTSLHGCPLATLRTVPPTSQTSPAQSCSQQYLSGPKQSALSPDNSSSSQAGLSTVG